jgi:hypothetical protein
MMKARLVSLGSNGQYFPKGYGRLPGMEYVPNTRLDEAVVFEDFFAARLRMPPYLGLLDIFRKFRVQLHQLTSNAIIHISKFIWAITSSGGCPTADVLTQDYEFHYQKKKIQPERFESTLVAQFDCITFHPSRFRNRARLTPAVRNKWMSRWDGSWFYCRVPLEQTADVRGKGTYPLSCTMTPFSYATEVTFECGPVDADVAAFTKAASIIGGRNAVEEFLACGMWPLSETYVACGMWGRCLKLLMLLGHKSWGQLSR